MNKDNYENNIKFISKKSKSEYCICSACKKTGYVLKLNLPETKCFNFKNVSTKYSEYWLCMECKTKLLFALEHPKEEKTNDKTSAKEESNTP